MSKIHASILADIKAYAQFMSIESAASRVKRNRLNRHDDLVDEVLKKMKAA